MLRMAHFITAQQSNGIPRTDLYCMLLHLNRYIHKIVQKLLQQSMPFTCRRSYCSARYRSRSRQRCRWRCDWRDLDVDGGDCRNSAPVPCSCCRRAPPTAAGWRRRGSRAAASRTTRTTSCRRTESGGKFKSFKSSNRGSGLVCFCWTLMKTPYLATSPWGLISCDQFYDLILQGDPARCSQCCVDFKTKVPF